MHEAQFYTKFENHAVQCNLCPWNCVLKTEQTGVCKVRTNTAGTLVTEVYNKVAAFGIDPIEKKPLYHFFPGKNILSIGGVGCNLHCSFCQNHQISQCFASEFNGFHNITSAQLAEKAADTPGNLGIAYTYNEPFTFYEFMFETAELVHLKGMKNVVVSNGYINPEPLEKILPMIDAFNIDLKASSEEFYHKQTKGKLAPVLDALKIIAKSNSHLEITNLVIPGLNDSEKEFEKMMVWIAENLGEEVPLHLSRYFPQFKMNIPSTSVHKLEQLYQIAKKYIQYVYLGNVNNVEYSSTHCIACGNPLVIRNQYNIEIKGLNTDKTCRHCGRKINITF